MKKRVLIVGILIFSIFVLSFNFTFLSVKAHIGEMDEGFIAPTLAIDPLNDKDGDAIDDSIEEINKRNIDVAIETSEVIIESVKRNQEEKDAIRTTISYGADGIDILTQYRSQKESTFDFSFSVSIRKIVEFIDINFNGIYDPEIDDILQNYTLNNFSPAIHENYPISSDTDLSNIKISTEDENFTLNFYFAEEFVIINKYLINPIQAKMDLEVAHFKFLNSTSFLALVLNFEGENVFEKIEITEDEALGLSMNENGLESSFEGKEGYLIWEKNATIDAKSSKVSTSEILLDSVIENAQNIYLSYSTGETIQHSFKIGVKGLLIMTNSLSPESILFIILIIGTVGAAVAYSIYNYRSKKILNKRVKSDRNRDLIQDYSRIEIESLFDCKLALQILQEEDSILKLYNRGDINITAVAEDFYESVEMLGLEKEDKALFINDMLSLAPFERELIIRDMLLNID